MCADRNAKEIIKEIELSIKKIAVKKSNEYEAVQCLPVTHPDKVLYCEDNITKRDLVDYYEVIHEWMLPYLVRRPLTLVRCPSDYKKCFYQKHLVQISMPGLNGIMIKEKNGKKQEYIYIEDHVGLMAFPQLSILEIHPWGSRIEKIECPDTLIFDLDPGPGVSWKRVVKAAYEIKEILVSIQLKSFIKTTGGKGLHVVVPIQPKHTWKEVKVFSHLLVSYLVMQHPKQYVDKMTKIKRTNKIYIDYLRNERGATAIAPYSTRARLHAPIATPLDWNELTNNPRDVFYTIKTLPARLKQLKADPWQDYFNLKQSLDLEKFSR